MELSDQYLLRTPRLGMRRWKPSDHAVFAAMNQDPEVRRYFPGLLTPAESVESIARMETSFDQNGFTFYAVDVLAGVAGGIPDGGEIRDGDAMPDGGEIRDGDAMPGGGFIGFVGLLQTDFGTWFTPCVEIGWRLRREAWGFGYATEAAKECLRFGLEDLGLERIYSWTAIPNQPSERVMQKIGMKKVGEFEHPRIEEGHWLRRHVLYERAV